MSSPELSSWLQEQRYVRKWSQAEIAARIGVSQGTVSAWERGKSAPDDVQLDRLRAIFGSLPQTDAETISGPPIEGSDDPIAIGWGGGYPLEAVFVRTDQRTA